MKGRQMAQKMTVLLIDDLDGRTGDDIETVEFGLDGVTYEIDLSDGHARRLRDDVLGEFVEHARRTGGRIKRGHGRAAQIAGAETDTASSQVLDPGNDGSVGRGREQTQAIRDWARQNGYTISDRGRVPGAIISAFDEAHTSRGRRRR
jgi:hypothetical protein